jgi:hypothetical protein
MRKLLRREQFQALLEAMHVHDGGNKMTEALQRSVESNQTADIFDIAQISPKDKVR